MPAIPLPRDVPKSCATSSSTSSSLPPSSAFPNSTRGEGLPTPDDFRPASPFTAGLPPGVSDRLPDEGGGVPVDKRIFRTTCCFTSSSLEEAARSAAARAVWSPLRTNSCRRRTKDLHVFSIRLRSNSVESHVVVMVSSESLAVLTLSTAAGTPRIQRETLKINNFNGDLKSRYFGVQYMTVPCTFIASSSLIPVSIWRHSTSALSNESQQAIAFSYRGKDQMRHP